jgi:transposase
MSTRTTKSSRSSSASSEARSSVFIGVDVAKDELVIAQGERIFKLANKKQVISTWLKSLPQGCYVALESTSCYHLAMADLAHAKGHVVFLLKPQQIKGYRTATQRRAKTDVCDAQLMARYAESEHGRLRPYLPLTECQRKINGLLRRRATLVKTITMMNLSFQGNAEGLDVAAPFNALLKAQEELKLALENQISTCLNQYVNQKVVERLLGVVGIGKLTCAALLSALDRGEFKTADSFVAFLGLDPVARDSGKKSGRRRLSKNGDSETRRLLYGAAMSACQTQAWSNIYQAYVARGLSRIQALCILSRRLAITAWSIFTHGTTFNPERLTKAVKTELDTLVLT